MKEKIAILDRYLISQKSLLEEGQTLYIRVDDGFLTIRNEEDENGKEKTVTYFSEFDAILEIPIKQLFREKEQDRS